MIIFQFPNWQAVAMLSGWLGSKIFSGFIGDLAEALFYAAGFIWAYEEIFNGVNWFRRLLGAIVAIYLVVRLI